jgi:SAM-dependent methyltransferase
MEEVEMFDDILAFELFEYIWNPVQCFMNFHDLLKDGGRLWLSVPFLYPVHNPEGTDCLRTTEFGIRKILSETGFEIEEFEYRNWKDETGWKMAITEDGMKPMKNYPHHNATGFLIKAKRI